MCCVAFKKSLHSVLTDPAHLGAKDFRAGLEVGGICMTVTSLKINLNKKKTFLTNSLTYNLPKVKRLFELNLECFIGGKKNRIRYSLRTVHYIAKNCDSALGKETSL